MDAFIIEGPAKLNGTVKVSGSKNCALPLLFTAILFEEPVHFENVPRLWDIETTLNLMESMGASYEWQKEAGKLTISPTIRSKEAGYEWVKKMRAGILALGPLLAKFGEAKVSLPGGCAIGARPVNFHLEAMEKMGVEIKVEGGYILAKAPEKISGAHIIFPKVTVTGTENLLVMAALAEGTTLIENAASEPEVVGLGEMLIQLGAKIQGLGTNRLVVEGGRLKHPLAPIQIPPDRIEAGTWLAAAVATHSELTIENFPADQMGLVLDAFRKMGANLEVAATGDKVMVYPNGVYEPIHIETAPYPGFPTDMQAQILVAMCTARGVSQMRETVFENRFMHVAELRRMGAEIEVDGTLASTKGPVKFQGAPVMATDLRASAGLVIAGLCAEGETKISRIYHLDRGYQKLDEKLKSLGVKVRRVRED